MKKINFLIYHFRRLSWIFYVIPAFFSKKKINKKPIFIVGHQGNGATIVSRIIRKTGDFITVTGGKNYIGGADEMQSVMGLLLTHKFTGIIHKYPRIASYTRRNGWFYASNKFIDYFRFGSSDYTDKDDRNFKLAIKTCLFRNSIFESQFQSRFLDKSQSYLLKIELIKKILANQSPKFIVIVRNPLATCWRAAFEKTGLAQQKINIEARLEMSVEHWNNCFYEMKKYESDESVNIYRLEDILSNINTSIKDIFQFIETDFDDNYLPSKIDKMGIGSMRNERWFPVKTEVNNRRINSVPDWAYQYILTNCNEGIKYFKYDL